MNQGKNIKGIIYRVYNSGATDKVINLIDEQGSKEVLIAKGVRKPTSKKAHTIDFCNLIQAHEILGYAIPILTDIKLLNEFVFWKDSYQKIMFLHFFCEIIDKFCFEENRDDELFKILYNTLQITSSRLIYIASIFLQKVLYATGNMPTINECSITSSKLDSDEAYYVLGKVGYISLQSAKINGLDVEKISERIIKTQKYIIDNTLESSLRINLTIQEEIKLFVIELNWIENVIDKQLKSKSIILNIINDLKY